MNQTLRDRSYKAALLVAVVLSLVGGGKTAHAQDARTVVNKMAAAYQSCASYAGQANVDATYSSAGKVLRSDSLSVTLKYKRPNKLSLEFSQPRGSRTVLSDGATLTVYDASLHKYSQVPAAPTLLALLPKLRAQAGITDYYDPLYFLSHIRFPAQIAALKISEVPLNHAVVWRVTGVGRGDSPPKSLGEDRLGVVAPVLNWTWWIDKKTFLLQKIEMQVPNVRMIVKYTRDKKPVTKEIRITVDSRHIVVEATPNASLDDDLFVFHPPPGAMKKRPVSEMLKGGEKP